MNSKQSLNQCANTDKELWRSKTEDGIDSYYAKHQLFVTESGAIGLCEVGTCIVKPPEEWFKLANGGKSWNEGLKAQQQAQTSEISVPNENVPHHNAAFINAIWEEGTKDEACRYLQQTWNELCELKKQLKPVSLAHCAKAIEPYIDIDGPTLLAKCVLEAAGVKYE